MKHFLPPSLIASINNFFFYHILSYILTLVLVWGYILHSSSQAQIIPEKQSKATYILTAILQNSNNP